MTEPDFSQVNVLIVDDGSFSRRVLTAALEQLGVAKVRFAIHGEHALKVLADLEKPVDLVITDVMMPGMDGFDLVQRIRTGEVPERTDVPILVLTGKDPERNAERAGFHDVAGFILKPVTPNVLAEHMARALGL